MPYYMNGYQYPYQYQQQQQQMATGFVSVRSIEEAFNYPVAPGNSITFKDENAPYVYTKTKGFSPLEQPVFERYRLVKEEDIQKQPETTAFSGQIDKSIQDEIEALKKRITALEGVINERSDDHANDAKPTRRSAKTEPAEGD